MRNVVITFAFGLCAALGQLQYPGYPPGATHATLENHALVLSNAAVSGKWQFTPGGGVMAALLEDVATRRKLAFTNELFEFELADGSKYVATQLISDRPPQITQLTGQPLASNLASHEAGFTAELWLQSPDHRFQVRWRALLRDHSNYIRQEVELSPMSGECVLTRIRWLDEPLPNARTVGLVDGSPIVADSFFIACEDPHALNSLTALPTQSTLSNVSCVLRPNLTLHRGDKLTTSFVLGVVPAGQVRRAFLYYLERERAHPYRPFLHYNSWYDIAWDPFALNETNCLEAIRLFGERLVRPYGIRLDALVFDDGWDNPQSLWKFHSGFPRGFTPLADLSSKYGTHLGVWLSPFGGYGEPRNQRLKFGVAQGYETNATGFSLSGPKYYAAFKASCVGMMRNYGVNHFKFDGIAAGMYANGGADYYRDTEAMRRLMLELRQEEPSLYINLTTGSWPSPFWLRYADSVWRQGDDMGFSGKGTRQQQWLNYRDQQVYQNIVRKGPLFPLNSLMTQGVAYSRKGSAGDPTFDTAGFKDDVRAFFGSGTGLQELYIQPGKLTDTDWRTLAEAAQWSRANADVLVDTHWIGGDPSRNEIYGYASWNSRKSIIMLRNPDGQKRSFELRLSQVLELPKGAAKNFTLKSPWTEPAAESPLVTAADSPLSLELQPFEVRIYEALPWL